MSTQVACLTPAGSGAIAVIALRGSDAWPIVRRLFRPASGKPLPPKPSERATWFGHIGEGAGDEVIVAVPSLQPEPTVEIHCHGGRQVVVWLIESLKNEGCIEVTPERIAATNDAWALLPYAKTLRTAGILLDQAQGAFAQAVESISAALSEKRTADAQTLLNELMRYAPVGRHLVEPWRVVIAGAPNAGKSSLLNALAGYQRSIVAPIPGTTRDVVTATLAFDGWPVEIADTAGLRNKEPLPQPLPEAGRGEILFSPPRFGEGLGEGFVGPVSQPVSLRDGSDELEAEGIARARKQLAQADLCLWVIDTTVAESQSIESLAAQNEVSGERVLPVLNKIDQPPAWDLSRFPDACRISATIGIGIDVLIRKIVAVLAPDPPPAGAAVPYAAEALKLVLDLGGGCSVAVKDLQNKQMHRRHGIEQALAPDVADGLADGANECRTEQLGDFALDSPQASEDTATHPWPPLE